MNEYCPYCCDRLSSSELEAPNEDKQVSFFGEVYCAPCADTLSDSAASPSTRDEAWCILDGDEFPYEEYEDHINNRMHQSLE